MEATKAFNPEMNEFKVTSMMVYETSRGGVMPADVHFNLKTFWEVFGVKLTCHNTLECKQMISEFTEAKYKKQTIEYFMLGYWTNIFKLALCNTRRHQNTMIHNLFVRFKCRTA